MVRTKATSNDFHGDSKVASPSLTWSFEKKMTEFLLPKFPRFLQGYHLTLLSLPISACLLFFDYLAQNNINYLWLASLMIFLQWFTDTLDGALGKYRNFGTRRWGFYMDHLFDYFFLAAMVMGYMFVFDVETFPLLFLFFVLAAGFMVSVYLDFGATQLFKIHHFAIGPTESRLFFIFVNFCIIFGGVDVVQKFLPWMLSILILCLFILVYKEQKKLWRRDMEEK